MYILEKVHWGVNRIGQKKIDKGVLPCCVRTPKTLTTPLVVMRRTYVELSLAA